MDHSMNSGRLCVSGRTKGWAAVSLVAAALVGSSALAQSGPQPATTVQAPVPQPATTGPAPVQAPAQAGRPVNTKSAGSPTRYLPNRFGGRAGVFYKTVWGVDSLRVKLVESGEIIRFAWRVLDADRAKVLNDKKVEPSLIDPQAGVSLVVPTMEKIGQLRQSAPPEVGRSYWMAFSNNGQLVKRGDRVNVVIGPFRAEGLVVD